jgi:protein phosphatase
VFQITHDHTVVQSLLDESKITAGEVASHPQRMLLLRALTADRGSEPDLQLHQALPGDRYLLSSDGLPAVVAAESIARVLLTVSDPDQAAKDLIAWARPDRTARCRPEGWRRSRKSSQGGRRTSARRFETARPPRSPRRSARSARRLAPAADPPDLDDGWHRLRGRCQTAHVRSLAVFCA